MATAQGAKSALVSYGGRTKAVKQDDFVRVRKSDLDKLTTEVMQLREFLPRVLNRDFSEVLHKARAAQTRKEHCMQEQERLRQKCLHLDSQLVAVQTECQKEREVRFLHINVLMNWCVCMQCVHVPVCVCAQEKLLLREQLWQSGAELQQQADFCSGLGSTMCHLLWSSSTRENTVTHWLADGMLQPFLAVASQTLESFVRSLDDEVKTQTEDHSSQEHQFVLALAGTITNIAAVTRGRDFLSGSAPILLDTMMKLLQVMKPGIFPRLKVLMLMTLYNVSISVKGLKYISESPEVIPLIWTLLDDGDWEVCLHTLRLLQSMLVEEEVLLLSGSSLLDPELQKRVGQLTSSGQANLRLAAQQILEDLQALQQDQRCKQKRI
ncbi:heat shock factor 2-binding protein isoform X4 [Takifugu flavidus]|nr:heat shock factor 2-binding protein isoform X4 [Takifugu flavidus]